MELPYETFIDVLLYVALFTWLWAIVKLYFPAVILIGKVDSTNTAYKHRWVGLILWMILTIPFLPWILWILISNKRTFEFLESYIPAYMGVKRNKK